MTDPRPRLTILLGLAFLLATAGPAAAQPYGVTRIAGPPLDVKDAPSINAVGTVAFWGTGSPIPGRDVFVGAGDGPGQPLYTEVPAALQVPPGSSGLLPYFRISEPIVNAQGRIAFYAQAQNGWLLSGNRFGAPLSASIRSCSYDPASPYEVRQDPGGDAETFLSLNDEGRVIVAGLPCPSPGSPSPDERVLIQHFGGVASTLVDTTGTPFEQFLDVALEPSSGRFLFSAEVGNEFHLYLVDGGPPVRVADTVTGGFRSLDLNDDGLAVFVSGREVYQLDTTDLSIPPQVALSAFVPSEFTTFFAAAINASGEIAVHGLLRDDARHVLVVRDPATGVLRRVAEAGVTQFEMRDLEEIEFGPDGLNDAGQLAITAELDDGNDYVLRLEPDGPLEVDLALSQTVFTTPVSAGSPVEIGFTIANQGGLDANFVRLVYQLPPGFSFDGAQGCVPQQNGSQIDCLVFDVPAGTSRTMQLTVTPYLEGLYASNAEAVPGAGQPDADPNDNFSSVGIDVPPALGRADLLLEKSVAPASADPGDTVVYTLEVTNTGPDPATALVLTDKVPPAFDLDTLQVTGLPEATVSDVSRTVVWNLDALGPNDTWSLEVSAELEPGLACQRIVNVATVAAEQADLQFPNVVESELIAPASGCLDLGLSLSVDEPAPDYEADVELRARVENLLSTAGEDATGVAVEVVVDPALDVDPASLPGTAILDATTNTITWQVGSLAIGEAANLMFSARTPAEADVPQAVLVTSASLLPFDQADLDGANDTAEVEVIVGATDLAATTSSEVVSGGGGANFKEVSLAYQIENLGPADAAELHFDFNLAASDRTLESVSSAPDLGLSCSLESLPLSCTSTAGLAVGQSATITAHLSEQQTGPTSYALYQHVLTVRDPFDPNPHNNEASAFVSWSGCGLGAELAPILVALWLVRERRRRRSTER